MHGLNWYDFHARQYDPIFGRFHTVDPLAEKYYNISPYVYCANNPLKYIDPTGMYYTYNWSRKQYENEYEYGDKVEWSEVFLWLMTPDFLKTDQDQEWGSLYIYAVEAFVTLSAYLANSGKGYLGHSWIEIESKNGELTSFGTFRKGAVGAEFQINYEKINDYKNTSRNAYNITSITNKQRLLIDIFNLKKENREWGGYIIVQTMPLTSGIMLQEIIYIQTIVIELQPIYITNLDK